MHHSAAENLEPAGLAAHAAARPPADDALDVHLGGGLREGEVGRPEAQVQVRLEDVAAEGGEDPLEVREVRALVDDEALDLLEHRGMGEIGIAAVDAAARDHPERRRLHRHDPDLHVRRVRPEQEPVVEVEGVVHGPGRVVRGNVECFEVVEVVLDLGAFHDVEPEVAKERLDPFQGPGNRVEAAGPLSPSRKGHVDSFPAELGVHRGPGQCLAPGSRRLRERVLDLVERLAGGRPLGGGERAETPELLGDDPLTTEKTNPHTLHFLAGRGRVQRGESLGLEVFDLRQHGHVRAGRPFRTDWRQRQGCTGAEAARRGALKGRGSLARDDAERRLVLDGQFGQDLAIDGDARLVEPVDETTVREAVLAGRSVDSGDPERPELALALPAVPVCVLAGLDDRLPGDAIAAAARAVVALRLLEDLLAAGARLHGVPCSGHRRFSAQA